MLIAAYMRLESAIFGISDKNHHLVCHPHYFPFEDLSPFLNSGDFKISTLENSEDPDKKWHFI